MSRSQLARREAYFNAGTITGMAVFGFIVVLVIANIIFFCWYRRKLRKALPEEYRKRPGYHPFRTHKYAAVQEENGIGGSEKQGTELSDTDSRQSSMFSRDPRDSQLSIYQAVYDPVEPRQSSQRARAASVSPLIPVQVHPPSPPAPAARPSGSRLPSITPLTLDSAPYTSRSRSSSNTSMHQPSGSRRPSISTLTLDTNTHATRTRSSSNTSLNRYYNASSYSRISISEEGQPSNPAVTPPTNYINSNDASVPQRKSVTT